MLVGVRAIRVRSIQVIDSELESSEEMTSVNAATVFRGQGLCASLSDGGNFSADAKSPIVYLWMTAMHSSADVLG